GGGGAAGGGGDGCDVVRPDACSPETLDDAENCCASGRSCQGGACEAGECRAVMAAVSPSALTEEVLDVVVVGGNLYWTSGYGSKLYMTPAGGGPVYTHATSDEEGGVRFITRLAADATHLYYTNFGSGRIVRVPLEGGAPELVAVVPDTIPKPEAGFGQIAAGGGFVAWAMATTGGVYVAPLASLPAEPLELAPGLGYGVAIDATHVYWGTEGGTIMRRPLANLSAASETVVEAQNPVRDLAVAGDRVYWADIRAVYSAAKVGVNKLLLTLYDNGPTPPLGVATDGRHVYVTTAGRSEPPSPGALYRVPLLGGSKVKLAETQQVGDMRAVAIGCNTLYLANNGDQNVLKLAR
ncbi:MAG TPA: hypothetical protein VFS00_01285, partial [Polyangiaceae bacterium]|nr:hypothetical protein [Polyangiaceae bacterium]